MVKESTDAHGHKLRVKESMFNRTTKISNLSAEVYIAFPLATMAHAPGHLRNPRGQPGRVCKSRTGDLQSRNDWCSEGPKVSKGLSMVSRLHVWPSNLHQPQQWPSFVGKYSSTIEHMGDRVMKTRGFDGPMVGIQQGLVNVLD